jgi:hypothetical protein
LGSGFETYKLGLDFWDMILGPEILGPGWRRRPLRRDRRQREPGKTTTNNKTKQRWCQTQESVPLSLSQRPHSLTAPIASLFFRLRSCSPCVSSFFFLLALFFFFLLVFPPNRSRAERLSLELLLRQSLFAASELVLFQLSVVESHRYS